MRNLKGMRKYKALFLLMASVCMFLLTGCPRKISEEERQQVLSSGRAMLAQALEECHGLKEGDWQIVSENVYWGSAYGYEAVKYSIEAGEESFQAAVNLDSNEVFTDYYGEEFEKTLTSYLEGKLESVPKLKEAPVQTCYVKFSQAKAEKPTEGMLPAALSPEGFEAYLEKCEREPLLNVSLSLAWYGTDAPNLSVNYLSLLTKETGRLPDYLTIDYFDCEMSDELDPMDLRESLSYYLCDDGSGYKQYAAFYDYYEVNERLVVQRLLDGGKAGESAERNKFKVKVDGDGYLTVYPEKEYYTLYLKGAEEGSMISYRTDDPGQLFSVTLKKASIFKDWCFSESVRGDWKIMAQNLIQD